MFYNISFPKDRCEVITTDENDVATSNDVMQILWHKLEQEIIKVREWIPHIGPLTKVIRLKLFLDIVTSSAENITRAMRGQPKRLSRTT